MCNEKNNGPIQVDYGLKSTLVQVFIVAIANTAVLASGMTLGFTAVSLPYMTEPNDFFYVTKQQASWIASIAPMATPLGCLINGQFMDRFGRKPGLLFISCTALIGWLSITINPSLYQMYVGRFLTGMAVGLSSTAAIVYSAEISIPSLRGYLVNGTSITMSFGILIVDILGVLFQANWQGLAALCSVFPVLSFTLVYFIVPESPVWLLSRDKNTEASLSLRKLRGTDNEHDVQVELKDLTEKSQMCRRIQYKSGHTGLMSNLRSFRTPQAYKPYVIMNLFFLFQQLSGIFVVIFYGVDFVREAGIKYDPFIITVVLGVLRLTFTVFAAWLSRKLGRRATTIISGVGMTVSLFILSTYLLMEAKKPEATTLHVLVRNISVNATSLPSAPAEMPPPSLIPLISILTYIVFSTVGFLSLPWAMVGEVFPSSIRGIASGMTTCGAYLMSSIVLKFYPTMLFHLSKHGVFYFYGGVSLVGTVFVILFLPETEGKTLAQIEEHFARSRIRRQDDELLHASSDNRASIVEKASNRLEKPPILHVHSK